MSNNSNIPKLADQVSHLKDKLRGQLLEKKCTAIFAKEGVQLRPCDITLTPEEKREYTEAAFKEILRAYPWEERGELKREIGKELNKRKLTHKQQTGALLLAAGATEKTHSSAPPSAPNETLESYIAELLVQEQQLESIEHAIETGMAMRDEHGNLIIFSDGED